MCSLLFVRVCVCVLWEEQCKLFGRECHTGPPSFEGRVNLVHVRACFSVYSRPQVFLSTRKNTSACVSTHVCFCSRSALAQCPSGSTHYGNAVGCLWRLPVTHDVTLERPTSNMNNLRYLLVGKHPQYPNKRSLIKTRNPPSTSVCE